MTIVKIPHLNSGSCSFLIRFIETELKDRKIDIQPLYLQIIDRKNNNKYDLHRLVYNVGICFDIIVRLKRVTLKCTILIYGSSQNGKYICYEEGVQRIKRCSNSIDILVLAELANVPSNSYQWQWRTCNNKNYHQSELPRPIPCNQASDVHRGSTLIACR